MSIQPNELRRGNLIQDNIGQLQTVKGISEDGIEIDRYYTTTNEYGGRQYIGPVAAKMIKKEISFEIAQPIPLTAEWLERLGFKDVTEGYRATGSEGGIWRIVMPHNGKYLDLYEDYDFRQGKIMAYFMGHYENKMSSVHQLQNLFFALTGEELTVKEMV